MKWKSVNPALEGRENVQRLNVDRTMIGILAVFAILGLLLVGILLVASTTLSGLRAFSTMQTYWTEYRSDSLFELSRYIDKQEIRYYERHKQAVGVLVDAQVIREELLSEKPDYHAVREALLQIGSRPRDIRSMIKTFERFNNLQYFAETIQAWNRSDVMIQHLEVLARNVHEKIQNDEMGKEEADGYLAALAEIDRQFRVDRDEVAEGISQGTALLTGIITWLSIFLGTILLLTGTLLSFRFLRSIKSWISTQKAAEEKIMNQLEEKTILLEEIHDRVKNNMSLISSLLQLQADYVKDDQAVRFMKNTISRIHSLSIVHEELYEMEDFANVRMDKYIRRLTESIRDSYLSERKNPEVKLEVGPVTLDMKKAIPCGLLLNELISNAFNYAFPERTEGKILIRFEKTEDDIELLVKDNGIGLPADFEIQNPDTLGMTLIHTLAEQLDAEVRINRKQGTEISISTRKAELVGS